MAEVKVVDAVRVQNRYRMNPQAVDAYRQKKRSEDSVINRRQAATVKTMPSSPVTKIAAAPKTEKKLKVAAYCRVSTLMESQETSIEAQQTHYEKTIRANDEWEYAGVFLETGISGTKAEIRPELQKLLAKCEAGDVDMVLTKSISRFARNTTDCLEMVRRLTKLGTVIRFEKEAIDSGTMDSEFMLSILASFAQEESHSISGNMKWAIRRKFKEGTYKQPIAPYGYEWNDDELVVIPDQAEVVKVIFQMSLSGLGGKMIAVELNKKNIPSATGGRWSEGTIRSMIKNPVYMGDVLYQKTYMDEHFSQRKNDGELDQYYDEDHHDGIISKEDFEAAQVVMNQRAKEVGYKEGREKNRSANRYCFSCILFCKACGSPMYRQINDKSHVTWICRKHGTKPDLCRMKPEADADLKAAFINCLNKLAWAQRSGSPDIRVLDIYENQLGKTEAEKNAERLKEIEMLLDENHRETQKLTAIVLRDHFLPEHREKKAFLSTQEKELMTEKNRILISGAPSGTLQQLKTFIGHWQITADADAFPEETFTQFVEKCTVNSQKMVTFHFRCGLNLTESLYRTEVE